MRFAIIAPDVPTKRWKENFERIVPKIPLLIGENTDTPEDVVCVMVWNQTNGSLAKFIGDDELYNNANTLVSNANILVLDAKSLTTDIQKNPKKYLRAYFAAKREDAKEK